MYVKVLSQGARIREETQRRVEGRGRTSKNCTQTKNWDMLDSKTKIIPKTNAYCEYHQTLATLLTHQNPHHPVLKLGPFAHLM